jgi:hypothetical protein
LIISLSCSFHTFLDEDRGVNFAHLRYKMIFYIPQLKGKMLSSERNPSPLKNSPPLNEKRFPYIGENALKIK